MHPILCAGIITWLSWKNPMETGASYLAQMLTLLLLLLP